METKFSEDLPGWRANPIYARRGTGLGSRADTGRIDRGSMSVIAMLQQLRSWTRPYRAFTKTAPPRLSLFMRDAELTVYGTIGGQHEKSSKRGNGGGARPWRSVWRGRDLRRATKSSGGLQTFYNCDSQKFSIIHTLSAEVYSTKARWRPSGDGTAYVGL
jgi:hypothetical protein